MNASRPTHSRVEEGREHPTLLASLAACLERAAEAVLEARSSMHPFCTLDPMLTFHTDPQPEGSAPPKKLKQHSAWQMFASISGGSPSSSHPPATRRCNTATP